MSIASAADYRISARQQIIIRKDAVGYGSGVQWTSERTISGSPGAAAAPGNATSGVVPTSSNTGYPVINAFAGVAYIAGIEASLSAATAAGYVGFRWLLADILWCAGGYLGTSNVTLSGQPSFSSRLPGGSFQGLQLWSEGVFAGTTPPAIITVGYTNQSGTSGQSTGAFNFNPPGSNVGLQAMQFPLAAGDTGIQTVDSVVGSGSGNYQCNLMILRPLVFGRVSDAFGGVKRKWLDRTCAPQIFSSSALMLLQSCDGSGNTLNTPPLELCIDVIAG